MCITTDYGRIAKPESLIGVWDNLGLTDDRFCVIYTIGIGTEIAVLYLTVLGVDKLLRSDLTDPGYDEFVDGNFKWRSGWDKLPTAVQRMIVETIEKEIL